MEVDSVVSVINAVVVNMKASYLEVLKAMGYLTEELG
jgi:hypothetical protein